ncbi:MAG: carbohydrate kinase, YjeF related protein [Candidatus Solibacter sp.]|nr:carbohydrate kinase, YjeF related protein [Candidatus Solibacter sp.]
MKVLTAAEMREVDRLTIEAGIPGIVLMENAGLRVMEFLRERFAPLSEQRVVVLCGKGNNGGDGMVIARQLHTCDRPLELYVVLLAAPEELKGDAAANYRMLEVCGCPVHREIPVEARCASLVIDALLGTGVSGPATGLMLEGIRAINHDFPLAQVVAVDMPSGMPTDTGAPTGEIARADYTVTFTAPKISQVVPPTCDAVGELVVRAIGSPPRLYDHVWRSVVEPAMFRELLAPRAPSGHKGTYGHALIVAGSRGKSGAAAMSGMAALRAGAGLVTVASAASAIAEISMHAAELMTEPLRETESGVIALSADVQAAAEGKTVIAVGPGLGRAPHIAALVNRMWEAFEQPMVLDADALVPTPAAAAGRTRILTPHPGEMARLTGKSTAEVQADRIGIARGYAMEHGVTLVLKGQRTVIAFPDGRVWINPTGSPAMATGGTGDILTGLIAGMLAQFPARPDEAVPAAVYLHGRAGELGAEANGEQYLIATDLLLYLPDAMEECAEVSHGV